MFSKMFRQKSAPRPEEPVLKVWFTQGEDGHVIAECPQLPGCMSQGRTEEEARKNIVDAMLSVLSVRMGTLVSEAPESGTEPEASSEEEFRLKPELIAV